MSASAIGQRPRIQTKPVAAKATKSLRERRAESLARQQKSAPKKTARTCPNPDCDAPSFTEYDGQMVCENCGTQVSSANIVSEIQFSESSAGAAVVQGAYVREGQRHARSLGGMAGRRMGGDGGDDTSAQALARGHKAVENIARMIGNIGIFEIGNAQSIYTMAATTLENGSFVQGRTVEGVAGCCLIIATRQGTCEQALAIADVAEKIHVDIYTLGRWHKEMIIKMMLNDPSSTRPIRPFKLEEMLERYALRLEFGTETQKVASDSFMIMRRMKTDWITEGRHPGGLCGACLILAARINNFRRTVREVVYVVKVTDVTIGSRLAEFKRTEASNLNVTDFRKTSEDLPDRILPPVMYKRLEKEAKKRKEMEDEAQTEAESGTTSGEQPENVVEAQHPERPRKKRKRNDATATSSEPRRDADGFVIPDIPIDPNLQGQSSTESSSAEPTGDDALPGLNDPAVIRLAAEETDAPIPKKKRGRPPKDKTKAPAPTEADLVAENAIEQEIEQYLSGTELQKRAEEYQLVVHAGDDHTEALERIRVRYAPLLAPSKVSEDAIIGEEEFDDDPEVKYCKLSEPEILIKEKIWSTENADWIRDQHHIKLRKEMAEAQGGPKKPPRRRNNKRKPAHQNEDGTPMHFDSAAEAVRTALEQKRGKTFSKRINYENLNRQYGRASSEDDGQSTTTANASARTSASPAPSDRSTPGPSTLLSEEEMANLTPQERARLAAQRAKQMLPTPASTQTPWSQRYANSRSFSRQPSREPAGAGGTEEVIGEVGTSAETPMGTDDHGERSPEPDESGHLEALESEYGSEEEDVGETEYGEEEYEEEY